MLHGRLRRKSWIEAVLQPGSQPGSHDSQLRQRREGTREQPEQLRQRVSQQRAGQDIRHRVGRGHRGRNQQPADEPDPQHHRCAGSEQQQQVRGCGPAASSTCATTRSSSSCTSEPTPACPGTTRLQVSLRHQTKSVRLFANYTFSKSLDNTGAEGNGSTDPIDSFNLGLNKGRSDFDRAHVFNLQGSYTLPIGKGHAFGGNMPRWANTLDRRMGPRRALPSGKAALRSPPDSGALYRRFLQHRVLAELHAAPATSVPSRARSPTTTACTSSIPT